MAAKFDIRNYTDGFKGFAMEGECKIVRLNDEFDQWIYVLNTKTNRATRFNAEGTNGKRIPVVTFEEKYEVWLEREANKAYEEAQIEDLEPKTEEPKAKKTRRSKDVAYEGNGVTLTAKQVDFIRHLPDTCFWEDGLDSVIWVDVLCDDIGGQFANKPMTVGAMISTLCEKGLGERATNRREKKKCVSFNLTSLGQIVADEIMLGSC